MVYKVVWSDKVDKSLSKLPDYIQRKFQAWAIAVEERGLLEVRKLPGFHDEPLQGDRKGQRSIRLNRAYRAIYIERPDGKIQLVDVIEVNKHEY